MVLFGDKIALLEVGSPRDTLNAPSGPHSPVFPLDKSLWKG